MTTNKIIRAAAAVVAVALCLSAAGSPARTATVADIAIQRLTDFAQDHRIDADALLSSPQAVRTIRAGTLSVSTMTVRNAIRLVANRSMEQGIAGPFELNAGALGHLYAHLDFSGNARELYSVTAYQIKGGGWTLGGHTAGETNVDTAASGPYLPTDSVTAVLDESVDFLGNIEFVAQFVLCVPFFGCVASFGTFAGEGVTLFDNTGPVGFPQLP